MTLPGKREILTNGEVLYTRRLFFFLQKRGFLIYGFFSLTMSPWAKKISTAYFLKILQVSTDEGIGKYSKLVEFSTPKLFQIRAFVISARKAKHFDVTTKFTYTPLGQSERATILVTL